MLGAGDYRIALDRDANAELVMRRPIKKSRENRLLGPNIYPSREDIGPAIAPRTGKCLRPEVWGSNHHSVVVDRHTLPEMIIVDAVTGNELLLLSPVAVTTAHEHVRRACMRPLGIAVQGRSD